MLFRSNLDRAKESVKKLTDDLEDLRDVYEAQDKDTLTFRFLLLTFDSSSALRPTSDKR